MWMLFASTFVVSALAHIASCPETPPSTDGTPASCASDVSLLQVSRNLLGARLGRQHEQESSEGPWDSLPPLAPLTPTPTPTPNEQDSSDKYLCTWLATGCPNVHLAPNGGKRWPTVADASVFNAMWRFCHLTTSGKADARQSAFCCGPDHPGCSDLACVKQTEWTEACTTTRSTDAPAEEEDEDEEEPSTIDAPAEEGEEEDEEEAHAPAEEEGASDIKGLMIKADNVMPLGMPGMPHPPTKSCLADDSSGYIIFAACSKEDESLLWAHTGDKASPFKNKKTDKCIVKGSQMPTQSSKFWAVPGDCPSASSSSQSAHVDDYYYDYYGSVAMSASGKCIGTIDSKNPQRVHLSDRPDRITFGSQSCEYYYGADLETFEVLDASTMTKVSYADLR